MRFGTEIDIARAPGSRIMKRYAGFGVLGLLVLAGSPGGLKAQSPPGNETVILAGGEVSVAVSRERGYPVFNWNRAPESILRGPVVSRRAGTAQTVWGTGIEVRDGSPFARVGGTVTPMLNSPYVSGGDLWVPLELLSAADAARSTNELDSDPQGMATAARDPARTPPPKRTRPWKVTIDPGHGGHDPGTVNRKTGAREKDIVLAVSRYLRDELRDRPGIDVSLTRQDDTFIKLEDRPRQAMNDGADLFLSIHVNAEPGRGTSARGFESYYLAPARDDESSRVARLENSVVELEAEQDGFTGNTMTDKIISGLFRDDNRRTSGTLGGFVQNEMRQVAVGPDRGIKPGPFWVLVGATGTIPAVLVELGFITNREDERHLTDPNYQKQLASALADSIERYFEYYEGARLRLGGAR